MGTNNGKKIANNSGDKTSRGGSDSKVDFSRRPPHIPPKPPKEKSGEE